MSEFWFRDELQKRDGEFLQGSCLYVRGDDLDLQTVVKKLTAHPESSIRYLHIYADQLSFTGPIDAGVAQVNLPLDQPLRHLRIFARSFLRRSGLSGIRITNGGATLKVFIVFEDHEEGFSVINESHVGGKLSKHVHTEEQEASLLQSGTLDPQNAVIPEASMAATPLGRKFILSSSDVISEQIDSLAPTELEPLMKHDLRSDGPRLRRNQFLFLLLNQMFTSASHEMLQPRGNSPEDRKEQESKCISTFRFIMLCTRNCASQASLYIHAQTMLSRLELPLLRPAGSQEKDQSRAFFVPILNMKTYVSNIAMSVDLACSVENVALTAHLINSSATESRNNAARLMSQLGKTGVDYINNEENERLACIAIQDAESKRNDLVSIQKTSDEAMLAFNRGVQKYLNGQKKQLIWDCVKGIGEIAFSIGVAVATCGAGSAITVGNIAEVLKKLDKAVTTWQKLYSILKKLAEVMVKIVPKLLASFGAFTKQQALRSENGGLKQANLVDRKGRIIADSIALPQATNEQIDYLGLMADWEEFELQADKMALEVKEITKGEKIEGLEEYHTALRSTVIRGQTALNAQRVVQEACSVYYRGKAQSAANEKFNKEVQAIAMDIQTKSTDGLVLQRALELHLVSLKRGIFVGFHKCLLSYVYRMAATRYPEAFRDLKSDMPSLSYSHKLNSFQESWAANDENRGISEKIPTVIQVNTEDHLDTVFDSDWKTTLTEQQIIRFRIPPDLRSVRGYWRLRVKTIDVTFHGAMPKSRSGSAQPGVASRKGDDNPCLVYRVEIGPHVMDRNSNGEVIKYWFPKTGFSRSEDKGGWEDPNNEFVKPPLFCHGQVSITDDSEAGWDLASVTGVRLDWKAQGIRMRV